SECVYICFFFQAEDGIRDRNVTGVQTCALPISDALIRKGFREFIPETTKIIIAQRVASVQDADRIILMKGGRIDAIGTHEELMRSEERRVGKECRARGEPTRGKETEGLEAKQGE